MAYSFSLFRCPLRVLPRDPRFHCPFEEEDDQYFCGCICRNVYRNQLLKELWWVSSKVKSWLYKILFSLCLRQDRIRDLRKQTSVCLASRFNSCKMHWVQPARKGLKASWALYSCFWGLSEPMRLRSCVRSNDTLRLEKQQLWVSPQAGAQASVSAKDLVSKLILSILATRSRALLSEGSRRLNNPFEWNLTKPRYEVVWQLNLTGKAARAWMLVSNC